MIIGWADHIKIVRVRSRARTQSSGNLPPLTVEMTAIFQVDCMISGIAQFKSSYVVLAYVPPDTYENEATEDPQEQRRKAANRPELRIIEASEEMTADALSLANFHMYGCNDYALVRSQRPGDDVFFVASPSDVVVVRPRDQADHIEWLVERERFEEALVAAEELEKRHGSAVDVKAIGLQYMQHLTDRGEHRSVYPTDEVGEYDRAASLAPKVLARDAAAWERWIYVFVQYQQLTVRILSRSLDEIPAHVAKPIIPMIPTHDPQLSRPVYEMIFGHLLVNDKSVRRNTFLSPADRQGIASYYQILAFHHLRLRHGHWCGTMRAGREQGRLDIARMHWRAVSDLLIELLMHDWLISNRYLVNRQPAKALAFLLRLRRPNVFNLIREHNLFTAVQDQALLLVDFDRRREDESLAEGKHGAAIQLLVDHTHSIPVNAQNFITAKLTLPRSTA